ncbi:Na(+)/H(+) antiporter NhaA [Aquicella siphonis]|uniref:Na(+)/H(+) antiporter NhaA n=1 Tax=Aquicella siphonis TaxID=254247 RepID=A0A5E4PDM4_9COXI|nr:Na+/H+ antiporter NhaA [Aquicella siphonis]VVC74884.1 Na(+)/H(+) antiporter NhaA [Aquicella siphonis]
MPIRVVQRFLQLESAGGIILFVMALLAMLWANSPLRFIHQQFIDQFLFVINDGLMTLFFLVVGLELKRGYLEGQFSRFSQMALPLIAALGGMVVPALIYCLICYPDPVTLRGWATPVATDIAFALGVLSLFGKRIPVTLKLFLMALAIFDDVGAILIITVFYSNGVSVLLLAVSALILLLLFRLNAMSVRSLPLYGVLGVLLWISLFCAGIHPTIAGVLFALAAPDNADKRKSVLHRLENGLHPWVAYIIMPLFALANAGFSLHGLTWKILLDDVVLGIVLGLLIGKQAGVMFFSWILIRLKWARLPENTTWLQFYGAALLCGIGFTMSLFLGTLSFANESAYLMEVRLGVIAGSLLSGLLGVAVLLFAFSKVKHISDLRRA